jgi:hypothetical protein
MTKSFLKITIPAALIIAGVSFTTMTSYAKPEYTKTTKKSCTYCHVAKKT